jgi:[protein-PII] uridylyltransferase
MPELLRSLTRLFRWTGEAAPDLITYGAETAGSRRLQELLDAGRADLPAEEEALRRGLLPAVQTFLAVELAGLEAAHRAGAGGLEGVALRADLVDGLIGQLVRLADLHLATPAMRTESEGCAVVALGGYGRRELNPGSDIDLMILYPRRLDPYVSVLLHHLLYFLWDLGFTVGHSCRSLADAAAMMEADLTTRTSLLEARFLAGSPGVFSALQGRLWKSFQGRRAQQYIAAKLEEQAGRHAKYGGSVYLQEPNVKEGPGGLRDFHLALWAARARHRLGDLSGLPALGLLSPAQLDDCLLALDFLLWVRSELHYLEGGKNDVLSLPVQVLVASSLGFGDEGGSYGVERFMRQYYLRAGTLHQLAARVVERCAARPDTQVEVVMRKLRARDIGDGFSELHRQLQVPAEARPLFQEDPVRLLKIFWYRQELGLELSPEAREAVRANLDLLDDRVRRSNRAMGCFLAILQGGRGVAATLRLMHQLGLLIAYVPEFARVSCLVQFDYYHRYTVDEHTFVLLDHLEGLVATEDPRLQEFRRIAAELPRPEILKLAILFHDIGKGEGHGHTERGVALAETILSRMGLADAEVAAVRFLIAHHLTMAHIAERRDLEDERLIIEFARQVESEERLKMLYLLTYLDINAVGPQVWNEWKASLLWELFIKTHTVLSRGVPEGEAETRRADTLRAALVAELAPEFGSEAVRQHLGFMPVRYILATSAAKVARHLQLIEQVRRGELMAVHWAAYPAAGYSEVVVCAPGAPGRFTSVVGTLTANGINILSAQLFSRADGVMIRAFQVSDGRGAAMQEESVWRRFQGDLRAVLAGQASARELIKSRRRDLLAKPLPRQGEIHTRVEFDNVVSDRYTVIDIRTQDRLGLLYVIASTLSRLEIDTVLAKITTETDQVMDVFYVTEKDGRKVTDEPRMAAIHEALVHAIAEGIA